jgi:hypothetical protein
MPHVFGGTRSTFGEQTTSRRRSSPSFGFGSATRNQQQKVYVSKEHSELGSRGTRTPGPVYQTQGAVGSQISSAKRSQPKWAFGTSQRFPTETGRSRFSSVPGPGAYDSKGAVGAQVSSVMGTSPSIGFGSATRDHVAKVKISEEHNKSLFGSNSPGPRYTLPQSMGKQVQGQCVQEPAWVFGSTKRFSLDHVKRASTAPGPGTYRMTNSVGPQVTSNRPSTPRFGFGTSNRAHQEKVFLSRDHSSVTKGLCSPGPGAYERPMSTGSRQTLSNVHSSAAWGFGTSERFRTTAKNAATSPGPGSYVV